MGFRDAVFPHAEQGQVRLAGDTGAGSPLVFYFVKQPWSAIYTRCLTLMSTAPSASLAQPLSVAPGQAEGREVSVGGSLGA